MNETPGTDDPDEIVIERLARIEHDQWLAWSTSVAAEVSQERRDSWKKSWVPYDDLSEPLKELDRVWARKALNAIRER